MDIRKWFKSPKTSVASECLKGASSKTNKHDDTKGNSKSSKKRRIISDSDSDEVKSPQRKSNSPKKKKHPESKTNSKEKSKRKNTSFEDFESDLPSKKIGKFGRKPSLRQNAVTDTDKTKLAKVISVSDFFGTAAVERSFKKNPKRSQEDSNLEVNHEDDDFSKTLLQLEEASKVQSSKKILEKKNKESDSMVHGKKEILSRCLSSDIEIDPSPLEDQKVTEYNIESSHDDTNFQKALFLLDSKKEFPKIPQKDLKKKESVNSSNKKKLKKFSSEIEFEASPKLVEKKKEVIKESPSTNEKKKRTGNAANYMSYLHRDGPRALGSKEIPVGEESCLQGMTFLVTGILESITRDETKELIEGHGGKLMNTLSKNTKFIVIGRDAGPSKLEKAEKLGTKQLDEDGLFDLVRTTPGKGPRKDKRKSPKKVEEDKIDDDDDDISSIITSLPETSHISDNCKGVTSSQLTEKHDPVNKLSTTLSPSKSSNDISIKTTKVPPAMEMWVDKYKPSSLKQVIGQQGEKSNAKKLLAWLLNWSRHTKNKKPAVAGKWNTSDDGSGFRAALLSGPPGIGKTTTAHLVCKESGFDFLELNASDTRSKKGLQQAITELLRNQSLARCFSEGIKGTVSRNHVIIMDEVDGMAGNEDRGGVQELIGFIKATQIPIICICNDRNHPKIRSLSNYCFDLRFQRPRVEQIKAAMMSIAFKEGLKVTSNVLQDVITASNQDIRQVLHNLSMWCAKEKGLSAEQAKADIGHGTKHIKLGPFDVLREVFTTGLNPKATVNDKASLFFHDYSIAPLFVQENYVHVMPSKASGDKLKHLELLSQCADSICTGDIIEKRIRSQGNWNLLPVEAIFASVIPGDVMSGNLRQMINFPAWLGKNSNRNHMDRILQELQMHMRTKITGNKTEVSLEYLPLLRRALTTPLLEKEAEGIPDVLNVMEQYCLLREDFDSIIELSLWSNQADPRSKISAKIKSAFTRAYNKECTQNPYATSTISKKKKGSAKDSEMELLGAEESIVSEESEDDDKLENDAMIKMKKPSKAATSKGDSTTSKKGGKTSSKRGHAR